MEYAGRLSVDPVDLLLSGSQVSTHASDLNDANVTAHSSAADSVGGLVGDSKSAVNALLDHWSGVDKAMHSRLTAFAEGLTTSGHGFSSVESDNAQSIEHGGVDVPLTLD